MRVVKSKYLIKCDIPGCNNIATNLYSCGRDVSSSGIAICSKCIKALTVNSIKKKVEEN